MQDLKQLMQQKGFKSIRQLAIAAKLPYSAVYDLANGKKLPNKRELEKLAKVLEVEISDLL